jgi:hypothetical protein
MLEKRKSSDHTHTIRIVPKYEWRGRLRIDVGHEGIEEYRMISIIFSSKGNDALIMLISNSVLILFLIFIKVC